MDETKKIGIEADSTDSRNDWVKCQSNSRPGRFYMFCKTTGETKWCPQTVENNDGASSSIKKKDNSRHKETAKLKESPPKLAASTVRTPAQDRLKRLQNNLKKDTKKVDKRLETKINNNTKKVLNKIKQLDKVKKIFGQEKPENVHETPTTSSAAVALQTTTGTPTTSKKSPKRSPRRTSPRKRGWTLAPTTGPSLQTLENSAKIKKYSPQKKAVIFEATNIEQQAEKKQESENKAPLLSLGIVSKIKEICKNTFSSYKNARIKTSNLKLSKKSTTNIKPMAVEEALKELQQRQKESGTPNVSPANSSIIVAKSVAITTPPLLCNTPKSVVVPTYSKGSANSRLDRLRQSLQQQPSTSAFALSNYAAREIATADSPTVSIDQNISVYHSANSTTVDDTEPMDWQPIEDNQKISISSSDSSLVTVKSPTKTLSSSSLVDSTVGEWYDTVNDNLLRFAAEKQKEPHTDAAEKKWLEDHYYFVLDTNVIMRNLAFVEDLSKMKLCDTNGTILYIPYCVLQELDKLKMRNENAKTLAVRAIKYLNSKIETKDKHIRAQSALDEREHFIDITSADDSIINCCLQAKQHIDHLILLTEDVNLRTKAICNNIVASTKSDLVSKHDENTSAWLE